MCSSYPAWWADRGHIMRPPNCAVSDRICIRLNYYKGKDPRSPEPEVSSPKKQKLSAPRLHQSPWKKGGRKEEMKVLLHSKFQLLSLFLSVLISGRSHDLSSRLLPIVLFSVNFLGPLACLPAFAWQHQLLLLFCPLPFPFIPGPSLLVRPNLRGKKERRRKGEKNLVSVHRKRVFE